MVFDMASRSLQRWNTTALAAFDEIENAHRAVGGARPGRRFLTQQLNHAYVVLLAARFQAYARELHTEMAYEITAAIPSADLGHLFSASLTRRRALDRGNAQPNAIAESFQSFGFDVWAAADAVRAGNEDRRQKLRAVVTWRNAIAHHDIDAKLAQGTLRPSTITLVVCRRWRSALNVLAHTLDAVAANKCEALGLPRPW